VTGGSTGSLWLDTPADHTPRAVAPSRVDVAVIGAGLAGLCTALLCAEDGASVAVFEAGVIAGRTTGHSTAKLTALHSARYSALSRGKSTEAAAQYAAANAEAVRTMRDTIERLGIDCSLVEATAFTCAATPDGVAAIEDEANAALAAGLPVELVGSDALEVPALAAVALAGQAHLDPVRLCRGLAAEIRRLGGTILEGVRVETVDESDDGCMVTAGDVTVRCDAAVITTHLPIVDPALLSGRIRPERSYVVAGPSTTHAPAGMYIAIDEWWSVRPANTGDGPVVLVGGEGHAMTDHVDSARHFRSLEALASSTFGVEARYRWSAFDYATTDGVPLIGRLAPRSSRRYVATGFRKWGISHAMVSARLISDLIAGRENPYLGTFDATRVLPSISRDLVTNTLRVAQRFVGDRIGAHRRPSDDLPDAGNGVVVRRGGTTVAIARSSTGELHAVDAVCTHLGCIVGFNDGEQTWDCPCHGSRFALDGTVLDGPATAPLRPFALTEDNPLEQH
jgi:glycine/D-amino acid oxidase-like deaminating enzyme/nitrite reductase/ring-hydroxylating ferredoxin subunit